MILSFVACYWNFPTPTPWLFLINSASMIRPFGVRRFPRSLSHTFYSLSLALAHLAERPSLTSVLPFPYLVGPLRNLGLSVGPPEVCTLHGHNYTSPIYKGIGVYTGIWGYKVLGVWIGLLTLASLIPVSLVLGRSKTKNAAKLAVYEATMIIANPAQTIPKTLAEKLRGVPEKNKWKHIHLCQQSKASVGQIFEGLMTSNQK